MTLGELALPSLNEELRLLNSMGAANRPDRTADIARLMREVENPTDPRINVPAPVFDRPYTPERVASIRQKSEQDQNLGLMLALSGDEPSMAVGRGMAGQNPEDLEFDINQLNQVTDYQQWQADAGAVLEGGGTKFEKMLSVLKLQAKYDSAGQEGGGSWGKMSASAQDTMAMNRTALHGIKYAMDSFKDEYTQVIHPVLGQANAVSNWFVGQGWEDRFLGEVKGQNAREAANWWAAFNHTVVAPLRHELFGATLTTGERSAWDALQAMGPGNKPRQIHTALGRLHREIQLGTATRARMAAQQYGPDAVMAGLGELGDTINIDDVKMNYGTQKNLGPQRRSGDKAPPGELDQFIPPDTVRDLDTLFPESVK